MFRRVKNHRRSNSKDASPADHPPLASPPKEDIQSRTRMSHRVFRDRRRTASTDMETGRNAFFRKMHISSRTSDEQYQSQRFEATVTDHGDIPAHPAIRHTRQPMEPREPGYEDFTGPVHSRQKSADLDKIRKSLSTRHEALRMHEDPYSQVDAASVRGHRRQAQSFSGHRGNPPQHGEGALSYEAAAAAAAALRPRSAKGSGGTHSTRTSEDNESSRASSARTMRLPMQSGRGRLVMIPARSPGSEHVEDPLSTHTATQESGAVDSKPPEAGAHEEQTRAMSKAPEQTACGTSEVPHGPESVASQQGRQRMNEASDAMISPGTSSRPNAGPVMTVASKQRVRVEGLPREDSETLSVSESTESSSDTQQRPLRSQPSRSASGTKVARTPSKAPSITSSSATPEKVTGDAQPDGGYKLALDDTARPSRVQVPRSTPAGVSELDVDNVASSLGAVTLQHHPELALDYTRHEREPVVHEENRTHIHTIYEPQRTRSFHFHERRDIIQPIIDPEPTVLPAQHWMEDPETGKVVKIPDELGRQLMESEEMRTSGSSD